MAPHVITDLDRLHKYIDLPATACRWTVVARGVADPSTPGPTDTILWAYVELPAAAWSGLGAPVAATGALRIPAAVADAILPAKAAPGDERTVSGARYSIAALALEPYTGETGVRVGNALVFSLYSH